MSFEQSIREIIRDEARSVIIEYISPGELFPLLPQIATTNEVAEVMRVSDEVIRRMCDDGMPHTHAGRELRFVKNLLIDWTISGTRYNCVTCEEKSGKGIPEAKEINLSHSNPLDSQKTFHFSNRTNKKLARLAK